METEIAFITVRAKAGIEPPDRMKDIQYPYNKVVGFFAGESSDRTVKETPDLFTIAFSNLWNAGTDVSFAGGRLTA
jgi:hypothetical protein